MTHLAPETRLLYLTAGGPAADPEIHRLLEGPIVWPLLDWYLLHENAASVGWRRLRAVSEARIPEPVADHLKQVAMVTDFRMRLLERRLDELLQALGVAGIPVVLLKGAAVGRQYLPSFADRPMGDIDLLVHAEAASTSQAIARGLGWGPGPFEDRQAFYAGHHHLPPMVDTVDPHGVLEIHTDLVFPGHPFAFGAPDVWRRAVPVGGEKDGVFVPCMEHLLLHLSIHFAWSHMFRIGAWRTFRDLGLIVDRSESSWPVLVEEIRRARAASAAYWCLRLAGSLCRIDIPEEVLVALRPTRLAWLESRLEDHFERHLTPPERGTISMRMERWLWRMGMQPRASGHGAIRPWQNDDEFGMALDAGGEPLSQEPAGRRLRGWRKMAGQSRYLWSLAVGGS